MIEDLQIVYDHSMLYAYELALYAGKNSTGFLSFEVFLEKLPNIALIAYKN